MNVARDVFLLEKKESPLRRGMDLFKINAFYREDCKAFGSEEDPLSQRGV